MKTEIIEFNQTDIYCPNRDGQIYVAIKPVDFITLRFKKHLIVSPQARNALPAQSFFLISLLSRPGHTVPAG